MSIEYTIDIQLTELGYPEIIGQQAEADTAKQTPEQSTSPLSTSPHPAHSPQHAQAGNDGSGAKDGGSTEVQQQAEEDDSDDSEVSDVYEEEEVDEEEEDGDDDEEGPNNESSLSGFYRCSVCGLQLPSKFKLQDHMNLHTGARPYCCAECGKRFCQIYNYRVHLRTHAQTNDQLMCRVCLKRFGTPDDLTVHLSLTHFENEFYECDLCKRVFTSLADCKSHVELHKCQPRNICEVCSRHFSSRKSLERHKKSKCHRNFKCTDCAKTFTKKNALLKHSFSHLGLLPYTCVRCRCHFRLARLYRQHKCEPERIHCVACLREFLSQKDFQQHKKDTGCWGNQEPKGDEIRCLECGQRFDTSEELKKHAGAHQRVLKCAECGKGFRSALLLMSHMGGHAGKSPCLCQSCGLGFPHQQNYDSHRKTCGQTAQPAKRQASKSSSSKKNKVNPNPDSSNPPNTAAKPAAAAAVSSKPPPNTAAKPAAATAAVSSNPAAAAAPVVDSPHPGLVTEGVSTGSGPSDGLWKLTLDKQPPPGVKLVVFLPVSNGLTLPSATSPTLPVPALPPFSEEHRGGNVSLGAPQNGPLNLATGMKWDPDWDTPLDLSKKCDSSRSARSNVPLLPIKNEPGEFEISAEANGAERQEFKNSDGKANVKTNPDTFTEVKKFKMDPMDLSSCDVDKTSSGLIIDFKKEPQSPGPESDSWSSRSCPLTEKEIKMEVDVSHPASVEK